MPWHILIPAYILWCLYWFRWVLGDVVYGDQEKVDGESLMIAVFCGLLFWPVAVWFSVAGVLREIEFDPGTRTMLTHLFLAKPLYVRLHDRKEAAAKELAEIKKIEEEIASRDDLQEQLDAY